MMQSSIDRGPNAACGPLVTAVVPSRNHDQYVAQTLESVCAQTHRPLELVVIDDGSTDASVTVIEGLLAECRARLDHVVFERRRHRGLTRTLNRALTLARGEYLSIVASDDLQRPEKIERLLAAPGMSSGKAAVAFGDARFIDRDGQPVALDDHGIASPDDPHAETSELRRHLRAWPQPFPEPLGTYKSLLRGSYIPAAATLIRTRDLREIGGYDNSFVMEDYPTWLELARHADLAFVDAHVADKRVHDDNMSSKVERQIYRDVVVALAREGTHHLDEATEGLRRDSATAAIASVLTIGRRRDLLKAVRTAPLIASRDIIRARRSSRARARTSTQQGGATG